MTERHSSWWPPPRAGLLASLAALCVAVVVLGPPLRAQQAGAHATVVTTAPEDEAELSSAPPRVAVTFSEAVDAELGGLVVLAGDGSRVDDGVLSRPTDAVVEVGLVDGLGDGTYVASYRVVSHDGHPVAGAWVFSVGPTAESSAGARELDTSELVPTIDPMWDRTGDIARALMYLGTLVAAGATLFSVIVLDGDLGRRRLHRAVAAAAVVAVVGLLGWTAAHAALATGRGIDALGDLDVLTSVLRTTLGWTWLLTALGLAGVLASTRARSGAARTLGTYGSAAILVGYATWGHAGSYEHPWLSLTADLVHGAAAAVWLGGLVALALVVPARGRHLRRLTSPEAAGGRGTDPAHGSPPRAEGSTAVATAPATRPATSPDARLEDADRLVTSTGETVARFSQVALVAVALLAAGGAVLAWFGLDGADDLIGSSYARLVAAKAVLALVAVAIAIWNRRVLVVDIATDAVSAEAGTTPDPDVVVRRWSKLTRSLRVEAALLVVAVALTGVLVDTPPGGDAVAGEREGRPFAATVDVPGTDLQLQVNVVPGAAGENDIHLSYFDELLLPAEQVESVRASFSLAERDIGPIVREPARVGPAHFLHSGEVMAIGGTWEITVVTELDDGQQPALTLSVPVAP